MTKPEIRRGYLLDDCVARAAADGTREIVAYATVFDRAVEIQDQQGHYYERIARTAFDQTLKHHPNGRGVKAMFNHGLTSRGTPSDRYSMPFGVPTEMSTDARGLLTVTRVADTELGAEVYELASMGAITEMSFRGPVFHDHQTQPARGGDLRTVERTELGLVEYGPVALTGAYGEAGASIVAVRAQDLVEQFDRLSSDERSELVRLLSPTTGEGLAVDDALEAADCGYSGLSKHERRVRLARLKGLIPNDQNP